MKKMTDYLTLAHGYSIRRFSGLDFLEGIGFQASFLTKCALEASKQGSEGKLGKCGNNSFSLIIMFLAT